MTGTDEMEGITKTDAMIVKETMIAEIVTTMIVIVVTTAIEMITDTGDPTQAVQRAPMIANVEDMMTIADTEIVLLTKEDPIARTLADMIEYPSE